MERTGLEKLKPLFNFESDFNIYINDKFITFETIDKQQHLIIRKKGVPIELNAILTKDLQTQKVDKEQLKKTLKKAVSIFEKDDVFFQIDFENSRAMATSRLTKSNFETKSVFSEDFNFSINSKKFLDLLSITKNKQVTIAKTTRYITIKDKDKTLLLATILKQD